MRLFPFRAGEKLQIFPMAPIHFPSRIQDIFNSRQLEAQLYPGFKTFNSIWSAGGKPYDPKIFFDPSISSFPKLKIYSVIRDSGPTSTLTTPTRFQDIYRTGEILQWFLILYQHLPLWASSHILTPAANGQESQWSNQAILKRNNYNSSHIYFSGDPDSRPSMAPIYGHMGQQIGE